MYIELNGTNKAEIREKMHELEERGIAFIKCTKERRLTDVQYNKIITKGYSMTFLCENQYTNIDSINLDNQAQLINTLAAMSNYSKKELKERLTITRKDFSKHGKAHERFLIINSLGFRCAIIDNKERCVYSNQI